MANLLIHSMAEFAELIFGSFEIAGVRHVAEVGCEAGTMTSMLIDYTHMREGSLVSIDPAPSEAAGRMFESVPHARLDRRTSLEAIPEIAADAWLVDGDHNYYTVLHESLGIWERARAGERPFLAFYHDVGWPCARRDQYCDPRRIPAEYLHPHAWDRGVTPDNPGTIAGGFRSEGHWACATHEGGPRNGVLTAIEDFVIGREQHLSLPCVPGVFGLGILYDRQAPWAGELTNFLAPHPMNPLVEAMERNRLACYLAVIEWQDRHAA